MSKLKRKHAAPPRSSKALVRAKARRVEPDALVRVAGKLDRAVRRITSPEVLPPAALAGLTEEIAIGTFGKLEVTFTAAEEEVLAEKVNVDDVQMKPSGQPYLSHPGYTRWFNRAFNRGGWSLVPIAKPMRTESGVACPYLLYVHGKPAAFAMGEGDYHASNNEQTWGDALEATVASALRRCAKRLGVGLELWDKRYINRFIADHCVLVNVRHWKKGVVKQWRRVDDPPFPEEMRGDEKAEDAQPAQRQAPASRFPPRSSSGHRDGKVITEKQVARLWVIIRNAGRSEEEIRAWLKSRYNLESTKLITQDQYEQICQAVTSRGELPPDPEALAREAGQEG